MGELTLTGLDEDVLAQLSRRAAAHGRSVGEEVAAIVRQAITPFSKGQALSEKEWGALAAESRRLSGRLSVRTIDLLHEGREERLESLCSSS